MNLSQAIVRLGQVRPDIVVEPLDTPILRKAKFGSYCLRLGCIEIDLLTGEAEYAGNEDSDPRDRSER